MGKPNTKFKPFFKLIRLFKTDFRITTGLLFITTGICTIQPTLFTQILSLLFDIVPVVDHEKQRHFNTILGVFFISTGCQYHLIYIASKFKNRMAETLILIHILVMMFFSIIYIILSR